MLKLYYINIINATYYLNIIFAYYYSYVIKIPVLKI